MNLKISVDKPTSYRMPRRAPRESRVMDYAPAAVAAPLSSANYGTCQVAEVPKRRKAPRVARPAEPEPFFVPPSFRVEPPPSLISRAFSWLRSGNAAPKQLRVEETVSLGEKRFVAILHAEGRRFLIGGGTEGVSLLKQLDETS